MYSWPFATGAAASANFARAGAAQPPPPPCGEVGGQRPPGGGARQSPTEKLPARVWTGSPRFRPFPPPLKILLHDFNGLHDSRKNRLSPPLRASLILCLFSFFE